MTYTPSPTTVPDMNKLQDNMVQSINYFSQVRKIKVKDNDFIQKKVKQISDQEVKFRKFGEDSINYSIKMCIHAGDLSVFAECCEDDSIVKDDLLELLRPLLSSSKLNETKAKSLKDQLGRITVSLNEIVKGIDEYDNKITEKRGNLSEKIDEMDKVTGSALSCVTGGFIATGVGAIVAVAAAPFTAGASAVVPVAEVVVGLGGLTIFGGTATAAASTVVAGGSAITSGVLNYKLKDVREEFSQHLREMQNSLRNIKEIISICESHWEKHIVEIEDIIKKLECNERRIIKPLTRTILNRANKILANSESYSFNMRQVLNRQA
ncbi:hypothetical protein RclHR1_11320009 [Rhizophagus clarus]|uniref:Uncharacterized protein n=1 Tax=Rhizophagus clarus TaxID=94130 RepID=A0A2Z6QG91_9GLOM|nr:hypothetical protein RclHR1_11320009 [Rhizophagus clarus]GES76905.1 hypothetical protein GLOIN_2v1773023 [Rhizophagus clarus]